MGWIFFAYFLIPIAYSYPTPVDFDGSLLRWNKSLEDPRVSVKVESPSGTYDYYYTVVEAAMELWSDVDSSYIVLEGVSEGEVPLVTIYFKESIAGGQFSSGFAIFDEKDEDGPIHCKIEVLAGDGIGFLTLGKTVLHELGHCLGLGHSIVSESIMSYELDKNGFGLDSDDKAAISRLYPADGSSPSVPPGCSIVRGGRLSLTFTYWLLFVPLLGTFYHFSRERE